MRELGIDNFWYEIIESQVENYNERERYWIKYYNCKEPNGYNKTDGGEWTFIINSGVNSPQALIKTEEELNSILYDILNTDKKMKDIAAEHNLTLKTISAINRGTSYHNDKFNYPLRVRAIDNLDFDLDELMDDLINSKISYRALADKYHTTTYIIKEINLGNKFKNENLTYPLRVQDTESMPNMVRHLLKTTDLSMREIARRCGTSYTTVAHINIGRYHRKENEHYPIKIFS